MSYQPDNLSAGTQVVSLIEGNTMSFDLARILQSKRALAIFPMPRESQAHTLRKDPLAYSMKNRQSE